MESELESESFLSIAPELIPVPDGCSIAQEFIPAPDKIKSLANHRNQKLQTTIAVSTHTKSANNITDKEYRVSFTFTEPK